MDSERLGMLIERLAAPLELYARQWCDEAEDVVQEAFVKLAAQSAPPHNPAAWLFRTVRNGAINAGIASHRRRRTRPRPPPRFPPGSRPARRLGTRFPSTPSRPRQPWPRCPWSSAKSSWPTSGAA